ncbi:Lcl domain-containing protein [Paraglaciecola arctica]|uniref:Lcl domain-containing protein n=1 Tax=Paraglaciecola arctica TaxID=1128911 RepID=UPI001C079F61|nr:DUF1566 domain-containing protein [Paraglaciecola arctica]MBU3004225.1 DUF1566 domain-containing protein [Paraglaciecola arctica]
MNNLKVAIVFFFITFKSYGLVCDNSGQRSTPDERFILSGNGTAIDKKTHLMWKRCVVGSEFNGTSCEIGYESATWGDALVAANNSNFAGYDDWRLPSIIELNSIAEEYCLAPSINNTVFPWHFFGPVWSSTPATGRYFSGYENYTYTLDFKRNQLVTNPRSSRLAGSIYITTVLVRNIQDSSLLTSQNDSHIPLSQLSNKTLVFSEPGSDLAVKFNADGSSESIIFSDGEMVNDSLPGDWSVSNNGIDLDIYALGQLRIEVGADGIIDLDEVVQVNGNPLTVSDIIKPYSTPFGSIAGHKLTVYHHNFSSATIYQFNDDGTMLLADLASLNDAPTEGVWRYFNSNTWIQYSFDNGATWKEFTSSVGSDFDFRRRVDGDFKGNVVKVESLTDTGAPLSADIRFVGENLPDYSYVKGEINKRWTFKNTETAHSDLKAVVIAADAGTGVTVGQEILIGDVQANDQFNVNLQTSVSAVGSAFKTVELELRDNNNLVIDLSNSANNNFWLTVRTNRPPQFSPDQLFELAGQANTNLYLSLSGFDADGNNTTFAIENGIGSIIDDTLVVNVTDGQSEHDIAISITDGKETIVRNVTVSIITQDNIMNFYTDVDETTLHYQSIFHGTLLGLLVGSQVEENNVTIRKFNPNEQPTWPEVLAMLLRTTAHTGDIELVTRNLLKAPGVFPAWVDTYYTTARLLGVLDINTNLAETPTNENIAKMIVKLLNLDRKILQLGVNLPLAEFTADVCLLDNNDNCFSNDLNRYYAQFTHFFGLFMHDLNINPKGLVTRGELAEVMTRILSLPKFDLSLGKINSVIEFGEEATLVITNLAAPVSHHDGQLILSEQQQPTAIEHTEIRQIYINSVEQLSQPIAMTAFAGFEFQTLGLDAGKHTISILVENTFNNTLEINNMNFSVLFSDADFDGMQDSVDLWPNNKRYSADLNGNGIPDSLDNIWNLYDAEGATPVYLNGELKPYTYQEAVDYGFDIDGIDDDFDGVSDDDDAFPFIAIGNLLDSDRDGAPNDCDADCLALGMTADADDDNDGIIDIDDPFPLNSNSVPPQPNISSVNAEDSVLIVSFSPNGDGGSNILDYTVTCGNTSVTSSQSPVRIEELENDVSYACFVTARNVLGNSVASDIVSATPEGIIRSGLNIPLLKAILDAQAQPQ